MERFYMKSKDKLVSNIEKLEKIFPNCITEAKIGESITKVVNFDLFKQEFSSFLVEGNDERYQFTWPDKKNSILLANSPIAKTLRPCFEESVDFDKTENLYIEGDNLDALKLLQETYLGKVKMIYIDPPYNTGNDFVYEDDFAQSTADYLEYSGQFDEAGNRLVENTESNGRFHTDWLNMIYPRLKVARDLLTEDGVIFVSINDKEVENLKKICNEIFGESNFISQIIWECAFSPINLKKHFSNNHDFILCYAKSFNSCICNGLERTEIADNRYKNLDNDIRGPWQSDNITVGPAILDKIYEIETPNGRKVYPPSGRCWLFTKERMKEMIDDNRVWFGNDGGNVPRLKRFKNEVKDSMTPFTIWKYSEVGHSQDAKQQLKKLFNGMALFDYPKSVELIKRMLQLYTQKDSLILDFFSGSATTAHAIMKLNSEDGGNRKFIMVQIDELTYDGKKEKYKDENGKELERYIIDKESRYPIVEKDSEARKTGYYIIPQIGKERIRRAGKKIKEETGLASQYLDIGFRVLKVDSTNMKDVFYKPDDYKPGLFDELEDNIKDDRTPLDLLFQVMLEMDVLLSSKIEEQEISGKKVFSVMDDYLIACFDKGISKEVVEAIAKKQPYYAVFRDSCMEDDSTMTSFEQIFETYSKDTIRKVL